jgi:hypothetical protein
MGGADYKGASVAEDQKKQDRELIELLNELRVVLPGVQVLFAFLLTVPFTQRYEDITTKQRSLFFMAFLATAAATAFLIAPSSLHRLRWRTHDKENLLRTSNVLTICGTLVLAFGMVCVVYLITDVLYGTPLSTWVAVIAAVVFAALWYGLALIRAFGSDD